MEKTSERQGNTFRIGAGETAFACFRHEGDPDSSTWTLWRRHHHATWRKAGMEKMEKVCTTRTDYLLGPIRPVLDLKAFDPDCAEA